MFEPKELFILDGGLNKPEHEDVTNLNRMQP